MFISPFLDAPFRYEATHFPHLIGSPPKADKVNPQTAFGGFFHAQMKRRDLGAYGVCFPFSDALPFLIERKRKRFLAFARNDGTGKWYSHTASFSRGRL